MKRLFLPLLAVLMTFAGLLAPTAGLAAPANGIRADVCYGFEDGTLGDWTTIHNGDGNYTFEINTSSSYIHDGSYSVISHWQDNPDEWLVNTVSIAATATAQLTFWEKNSGSTYVEHFGVYVSTSSTTDVSTFELVQEWDGTNTWTQYTADLSSYAGQDIYVAIRHFDSPDKYYLCIDDICIVLEGGDEPVDPEPVEGNCYGFEDGTLGDWTTIHNGDGNYTFAISTTSDYIHDGSYSVISHWQDNPDEWLVNTVRMTATTNAQLTFWEKNYGTTYVEHFGVYVSTSSTTDVSTFELVQEWDGTNTWTQYTADLSSYAGQDIYVAIRHFDSPDKFYMCLDDICIVLEGGDEPVDPEPVEGNCYGFEDGTLGDWTTIDADGDGYCWTSSTEQGIYLASGVDLSNQGYDGSYAFLQSGSYTNVTSTALTPNNYLVSPKLSMGVGASYIRFYACAQDASYPAEHFGVAVSTTGNTDAADFTMLQEWTMTAKNSAVTKSAIRGTREQGNWYEYTVDLSAYAGQEIYVALRHFNCTDQFVLNIDDICIVSEGGDEPVDPEEPVEGNCYDFEDGTLGDWMAIHNGDGGNTFEVTNTSAHVHEGSYAVHSMYQDNPDEWLVNLVKFTAAADADVTVWAKSYSSYYIEHFGVYVSTTSATDVSTFELVDEWDPTTEWTQYTADLSSYAGQDIFVAIRHFNSPDKFYLCIDDICIENVTGSPSLSINPGEAQMYENTTRQFEAIVAPVGTILNDLVWTVGDNSIITVDQNGLVTALALGTTTVTVTSQSANSSATANVTVIPPYTPVGGCYDFDSDFSVLQGWTTIDADGDGYCWTSSTEQGIYLVSGVDLSNQGYDGSYAFLQSGSYTNITSTALTPDNYLVSPLVSVVDGTIITFWACVQDESYPEEHFGVAVSTTGNTSAADFTTLEEWTMTAKNVKSSGTWYQYSVSLSAYAGQDIYVAIRHFNCTDQFVLNIDEICITDEFEYNLTISPVEATIEEGDTYQFTANLAPQGSEIELTWTVGDNSIISVDQNGLVTALALGTTTVTVANAENDLSATANVTVVTPFEGICYDFDSDFSVLQGWTTIDADGDGYCWTSSTEQGIYLASGVDLSNQGYDGSYAFLQSGSYTNVTSTALTPNNYLVSPKLSMGVGASYIRFYACAQDASYPAEHFGVAVSTTGNTDAADFTMLQEWTMTAKKSVNALKNVPRGTRATGTWYEYTVDLSAYAGQEIYVALRHFNCTDQFVLNIDDICIANADLAGDMLAESNNNNVVIYPNPTKGNINIVAENMSRVTIVNALGQELYNVDTNSGYVVVNMAQFASGIYMVRIADNDGNVTVKRVSVAK